jgi:hypothetical protein
MDIEVELAPQISMLRGKFEALRPIPVEQNWIGGLGKKNVPTYLFRGSLKILYLVRNRALILGWN